MVTTKGYALTDSTGNVLDSSGNIVSTPLSFSGLWYHDGDATTAINTANLFHKVTHFNNVGEQDVLGNIVASVGSSNFTVGANGAGTYQIAISTSYKNASGSSKQMELSPKIIFATPLTITDATNATPIVITTSTNHNLLTGDCCQITSATGNTAANGDWYINKIDATSFSLQTLSRANSVGNGAYTGNGRVVAFFPGNIVIEAIVTGAGLERGAANGRRQLSASDQIELHVANLDDTNDAVFTQITINLERIF